MLRLVSPVNIGKLLSVNLLGQNTEKLTTLQKTYKKLTGNLNFYDIIQKILYELCLPIKMLQ